ncbi:hypothetical protein Lal_00030227 [Lupinus albus]|nr:hypothetical protein Lal_00030227 [Lupinus albus]
MLLSTSMNRPNHVWEETWQWLSDGILYNLINISNKQGLMFTDEHLQNLTLLEIEKLLKGNRRNKLIYEVLNHDTYELKKNLNALFNSLTAEQYKIFHTIMEDVNRQQGHMFFLYGYGGTGKTHMWRTLTYTLRSEKHIVLTVTSSGIASLLLPGGRTTHSKFKIPVPTFDNSICNIHQETELV